MNQNMNNIRYVCYDRGDLVLFDEKSFLNKFNLESREQFLRDLASSSSSNESSNEAKTLFETLRNRIGFRRAGFINKIHCDEYRTPDVHLFYSTQVSRPIDPWVIQVDNGIKYTFDVTRTMFCKGNINEKIRLSKMDCSGEVVLDLFAGIGYFSLVFAVHCKAKHVYCCEWNPAALEALRKNIRLNNVQDRCTVFEGDNRLSVQSYLIGKCQRVQMGLIPTSRPWLSLACKTLDIEHSNGPFTIHFHENVSYYEHFKHYSPTTSATTSKSNDKYDIIESCREKWSDEIKNIVANQFTSMVNVSIINLNRIKSYAPHIDHLVLDLNVQRINLAS